MRVTEDGKCVELTVLWPRPLVDMELVRKKWLSQDALAGEKFERYHPKCVGFEASLKELRARASEDIESVARISLPFAVQTRIDSKSNLGWINDPTRIVCIDLKADVDLYATAHDENAFELL